MTQPQPVSPRSPLQRLGTVDPLYFDALLALVFTVAVLLTLLARAGSTTGYRHAGGIGITLALLTVLPLAFLHAAPLATLTTIIAADAASAALGYRPVDPGTYAAAIALFGAAVLLDYRHAAVAVAVTAAGLAIVFSTAHDPAGWTDVVGTWISFSFFFVIGIIIKIYREGAARAEEKAALFAAEREMRAREAVTDERARLARELHDVVGHTLSVVVLQAGAAQRTLDSKPQLARDALASIETASREAIGDMERMLGVLRSSSRSDEAVDVQPGLRQVETLVAQVREAGLPVEVFVEGQPAELPSSIDLSAYRIVQEALTNTLKHAGAAHARVTMRYAGVALELEICDDGHGTPEQAPVAWDGGRGLLGMRERVALFGGMLEVGPRPQGGFRVFARLPLGGDSP